VPLNLSWQAFPPLLLPWEEAKGAKLRSKAIIDPENFHLDQPFWADYHPFNSNGFP
jgi:hypothetical protein